MSGIRMNVPETENSDTQSHRCLRECVVFTLCQLWFIAVLRQLGVTKD